MTRLKLVFAIVLLLLALPFWRFADFVAIFSPFNILTTIALTLWFALFIAVPVKLIRTQIKTYVILLGILAFGFYAYWFGPLSGMATTDPRFNHCGHLTYTGIIYPVRNILPEAHVDDLEVRNQMCWLRKMMARVPRRFDSKHEVATYNNLISDKLMKPEHKYRAALPFVAALNVNIDMASGFELGPTYLYDSLQFWRQHYTEEISAREYSFWSWPHSKYIQFEYGLIEKNWQSLIDSIEISE